MRTLAGTSDLASETPRSLSAIYAELESSRSAVKRYPKLPWFIAIPYIALTTAITAYASLFGIYPILLFYALWLPLVHFGGRFLLFPSRDMLIGILLSALCCLSALWSDYPKVSLHYGLELASTIAIGIIIAKIVRTDMLIKGIIIGAVLVLIASLINGNHAIDPFSGSYTLVGLFGSKNSLGLFAEIGAGFSLLALFMKQSLRNKVFYGFFPLLLSLVTLYLSHSAGSVLSLAITLMVLFMIYMVTKMPRSWRFPVFLIVFLTFIVGTTTVFMLGWEDVIFKSFGKNATLTGRTDLWHEGVKVGMEAPYLGHGYSAFWVQGRPKAEELWDKFIIRTRAGFHFHNLFVEMFVELGIVGILMVSWLLLASLYASLKLVLKHGMVTEYVLALGITLAFFVRAFIELDIVSGFGIGALLMFAVLPRLAAYKREQNAG